MHLKKQTNKKTLYLKFILRIKLVPVTIFLPYTIPGSRGKGAPPEHGRTARFLSTQTELLFYGRSELQEPNGKSGPLRHPAGKQTARSQDMPCVVRIILYRFNVNSSGTRATSSLARTPPCV